MTLQTLLGRTVTISSIQRRTLPPAFIRRLQLPATFRRRKSEPCESLGPALRAIRSGILSTKSTTACLESNTLEVRRASGFQSGLALHLPKNLQGKDKDEQGLRCDWRWRIK